MQEFKLQTSPILERVVCEILHRVKTSALSMILSQG